MLQIEKERSLAKPNQLPAGPRKKRPLGRLFSTGSLKIMVGQKLHLRAIKRHQIKF